MTTEETSLSLAEDLVRDEGSNWTVMTYHTGERERVTAANAIGMLSGFPGAIQEFQRTGVAANPHAVFRRK